MSAAILLVRRIARFQGCLYRCQTWCESADRLDDGEAMDLDEAYGAVFASGTLPEFVFRTIVENCAWVSFDSVCCIDGWSLLSALARRCERADRRARYVRTECVDDFLGLRPRAIPADMRRGADRGKRCAMVGQLGTLGDPRLAQPRDRCRWPSRRRTLAAISGL